MIFIGGTVGSYAAGSKTMSVVADKTRDILKRSMGKGRQKPPLMP